MTCAPYFKSNHNFVWGRVQNICHYSMKSSGVALKLKWSKIIQLCIFNAWIHTNPIYISNINAYNEYQFLRWIYHIDCFYSTSFFSLFLCSITFIIRWISTRTFFKTNAWKIKEHWVWTTWGRVKKWFLNNPFKTKNNLSYSKYIFLYVNSQHSLSHKGPPMNQCIFSKSICSYYKEFNHRVTIHLSYVIFSVWFSSNFQLSTNIHRTATLSQVSHSLTLRVFLSCR